MTETPAAAGPARLVNGPLAPLDFLVGDRQHAGWNCQIKDPGGLQIDHEFELDGKHHRDIRRLFTVENAATVNAELAISILNARDRAC